MEAQAVIFDLDALTQGDAQAFLHRAVAAGRHCVLVSDLPRRDAVAAAERVIGDTAHHVFSVVLTDADFDLSGHASPLCVALRLLELDAGDAIAVAGSECVREAARSARITLVGHAVPRVPGSPVRAIRGTAMAVHA